MACEVGVVAASDRGPGTDFRVHRAKVGGLGALKELIVRRTSYIVAYRVGQDCVRILRVLHSAQLWPGELTDLL